MPTRSEPGRETLGTMYLGVDPRWFGLDLPQDDSKSNATPTVLDQSSHKANSISPHSSNQCQTGPFPPKAFMKRFLKGQKHWLAPLGVAVSLCLAQHQARLQQAAPSFAGRAQAATQLQLMELLLRRQKAMGLRQAAALDVALGVGIAHAPRKAAFYHAFHGRKACLLSCSK